MTINNYFATSTLDCGRIKKLEYVQPNNVYVIKFDVRLKKCWWHIALRKLILERIDGQARRDFPFEIVLELPFYFLRTCFWSSWCRWFIKGLNIEDLLDL